MHGKAYAQAVQSPAKHEDFQPLSSAHGHRGRTCIAADASQQRPMQGQGEETALHPPPKYGVEDMMQTCTATYNRNILAGSAAGVGKQYLKIEQCVTLANTAAFCSCTSHVGSPYKTAAKISSRLLPSLSPTTKAAAEPARAPNREELTIRPDWKELRSCLCCTALLSPLDTCPRNHSLHTRPNAQDISESGLLTVHSGRQA